MREVIAWIRAVVLDHGIPLVTGGLITAAINIGERYVERSIDWKWYTAVIALSLLIANFRAWQAEHRALRTEQDKNDVLCLPNIVLAPNGFRAEKRYFGTGGNYTTPLSCLNVYFTNDPRFPTDKSIATSITSTLVYRSKTSGAELFFLNGRWGDTQQPTTASEVATSVQLLPVDFPIGVYRELNLAFKYIPDAECYGFSNHSYGHPDWRIPNCRLSGEEFIIEVRLRGPHVDRSWAFEFKNPGPESELETVGFKQIN